VATGFGSGLLKPAPGTWGSLAALAGWLLLTLPWASALAARVHLHSGRSWPLAAGELLFALLPVLMTWVGVRASDLVVRETGTKDPGWIVADEWAGMWITLWPVRWALAEACQARDLRGIILLLGVPFVIFRVLDITKPWFCHPLQQLPGGEGIVADDVAAGLMGIPLVLVAMAFMR